MVSSIGDAHGVLEDDAVLQFVHQQVEALHLAGRSLCVVVPDGTRSCPLPLLLRAVHEVAAPRASRITIVIALGTHAAMREEQLAAHLGYAERGLGATYPGLEVRNHEWWEPATFATVGRVTDERVAELSEGRITRGVDVRVNRAVVEHDVTMVLGPVFPHEVVGFSGGTKYLFPGVSGPELIDVSHWLGALISSSQIIGTRGTTPVRALIDDAAAMVGGEQVALCLVVRSGGGLHALAFGEPREAWAAAADISARAHVRYLDAPVRRVLSLVPPKYDDMWTGAKGFYKVEPVVVDGGEVVVHAPHITEVSRTHPEVEQIGYHNREYFLGQWDRFSHLPWGVLAHSTHLRGLGTWSAEAGERNRVRVTLATGIPAERVRAVDLGHLDPSEVDVDAWAADPGTLVVRDAGEVLFRLRSDAPPA